MNKKILILVVISIFLQVTKLVYLYQRIESIDVSLIIMLFWLIAIPMAFYLTLNSMKSRPKKQNILNFTGVFLVLPSLIAAYLICCIIYGSRVVVPVEIDPASIQVTDESGKKTPLDSFTIVTEKDGSGNDVIKFKMK